MDVGKILRRFEAVPIFDPFRRAPEPGEAERVTITAREEPRPDEIEIEFTARPER